MSEADSSSESEGEFTIKTNNHLSSASTIILKLEQGKSHRGEAAGQEGKLLQKWRASERGGEGGEGGEGGGLEEQAGGWEGWAGRRKHARGERCCAEEADN